MIDKWILEKTKNPLVWIAKILAQANISANSVTVAGFIIGVIGFLLIAFGLYLWGLVFILLNRLADGIDGTLARLTKQTHRGAFLDIALDFIFYSLIPLGFVFSNPEQNALAGACVIFSFIGTGTSFLSFAVIAEKEKLKSLQFPQKSIYYLGGLTEAGETLGFFILSALFPSIFPILAYIFACLCLITTGMRLFYGWKTFTPPSP
ncbi:inner membrane protein YnjF [Spirochaetota bacterium]|nr:inner membrane protein YnjF [Spirochaetota bacterium]